MPRPTELEIAWGRPESLTRQPLGGLMRVIRFGPNNFSVIEVDPEVLAKARQAGQPFDWIHTKESKGLTPEEVGQRITEILRTHVIDK